MTAKVREWIERRTGRVLTLKKKQQRGWEYMRRLG